MMALSKNSASYLLGHVHEPSLREALERAAAGQPLTVDEAAELREFCADLLMSIGFDARYQPNADGNRLEGLIDELYVA